MPNNYNEIDYTITVNYTPRSEDDEFIHNQLLNYETKELIQETPQHFSIFIKNESKSILGGILVWIHSESIYVVSLWIDDSLRGQGYGTQLLTMAEEEGIKHGCRYSTLDSNYHAVPFYIKQGYKKIGEIKNYIFNHSKIFLRKEL